MNNTNRPTSADIMTAHEVAASSEYLNSQGKAIERSRRNSGNAEQERDKLTKKINATLVAARPVLAAFVEEQSDDTLGRLKAVIAGLSDAELTCATKLLRHLTTTRLVDDIAGKLEHSDDPERKPAKALLHLHDMMTTDDDFGAMPEVEKFLDGDEKLDEIRNECEAALLNCKTDADAEALYTKFQSVLSENPDKAQLLAYTIMTKLRDMVLRTGFPFVAENLTQAEQNRYRICALTSTNKPWDVPLALPSLELIDGEPHAAFPSDIALGKTVEDVLRGVEAAKTCYQVLSPTFNSLQFNFLLPLLQRRCILELTSITTLHDIPLDYPLEDKVNLVLKGITNELCRYSAPKTQIDMTGMRLETLMNAVYGIAVAEDGDSAYVTLSSTFSRLRHHEGLEDAIAEKMTACLADCVIASLLSVLEESGEAPYDATMARVMIYYAIRFALDTGDLAFWDTPAYHALMAQVVK